MIAIRRPGSVPRLEDVEVGVGAHHPDGTGAELPQASLLGPTLVGPHFGEAGGKDDNDAHAFGDAVLEDRDRIADQHDG
jgi:hypothetical protein